MINNTVENLIKYCQEKNRVCPMPQKWDELWKMLPNKKRIGFAWEPSLPLILAAWHDTPALFKMIRLQEHIKWAETHSFFENVSIFLRTLPENEWFHIGD